MRGIIDRIEDGEKAVINVMGGGYMLIPVEAFDIKIHEGQHLKIIFEPDEENEQAMKEDIINLQKELLKKNKKDGKNEK